MIQFCRLIPQYLPCMTKFRSFLWLAPIWTLSLIVVIFWVILFCILWKRSIVTHLLVPLLESRSVITLDLLLGSKDSGSYIWCDRISSWVVKLLDLIRENCANLMTGNDWRFWTTWLVFRHICNQIWVNFNSFAIFWVFEEDFGGRIFVRWLRIHLTTGPVFSV